MTHLRHLWKRSFDVQLMLIDLSSSRSFRLDEKTAQIVEQITKDVDIMLQYRPEA
jgi:CO dehydrogenase nickel-insertion accessory protein CooC1